jgi:hypothetical protein
VVADVEVNGRAELLADSMPVEQGPRPFLYDRVSELQDERDARIIGREYADLDRFLTRYAWPGTPPLSFWTMWEMRRDPAVALGMSIVTFPLRGLGFEVVGRKEKQRRLVDAAIRRLWCSLGQVDDAFFYGYWPAEIVWAYGDLVSEGRVDSSEPGPAKAMKFRGVTYPHCFVDLIPHRDLTRPVLNPTTKEFEGLDNRAPTSQSASIVSTYDFKFIPRAKALCYVPEAKFGSWFGCPRAEVAHRDWYLKRVERVKWGAYLDRRGQPTPVGWAPEGLIDDPYAKGQKISSVAHMERQVRKTIHGYPVVWPYKTDEHGNQMFGVNLLKDDKRGDQFRDAITYCDLSIIRALVGPEKTGIQGTRQGSYAETSVHQDLFWVMEQFYVEAKAAFINHQIIPLIQAFNFPDPDPTVRIKIDPVRSWDRDAVNRIIALLFDTPMLVGKKWIKPRQMVDGVDFIRRLNMPLNQRVFDEDAPAPPPDEGAAPNPAGAPAQEEPNA